MAQRTDLLVIGAGPYAYSAAACARDRGIDTRVVGLPMSFWREQMPTDMYLRSGPDWHLDTAGEHTFAAYFEDRGLSRAEHDPVPIGVFLDHTDWFRQQKGFDVDERLVDTVETDDTGAFVATKPSPSVSSVSTRRWSTSKPFCSRNQSVWSRKTPIGTGSLSSRLSPRSSK